jgi:hypothetical protein
LNVSVYVHRLCGVLAYAPKTTAGMAHIAESLMAMCATEAEADWTTARACELYRRWEDCGIPGLRQIVSSFRRPKDGISVSSTAAFPDGIPASKPLPSPAPLLLPPGPPAEVQSATAAVRGPGELPDPGPVDAKRQREFDQVLDEVLTPPEDRPRLPRPRRVRQSEVIRLNDDPENEPRPAGSYKRITQQDIEAEVKKLREKAS